MLELKVKHGRKHVPLFDLPAYLGRDVTRAEIGDTIDSLMAFLDDLVGDPDLENDRSDFEPNGDELGDQAWIEWNARGKNKEGQFGGERVGRDNHGNMLHEDDEDEDPREEDDDSGQCDEDGINTANGWIESINCRAGPGCEISDAGDDAGGDPFPSYGLDQSDPEPWSPVNDLRARKPHRDRIRATRCIKGRRIINGVRIVDYSISGDPFGVPANSN
jgi:hypothetical protein